jgi:hypothetical protein
MLAQDRDKRFADAGQLHEQLLGYFYASGERFGAERSRRFLAPLPRESGSAPEIEAGVVFDDEQTGANDRTPVEVPQVGSLRSGSWVPRRRAPRHRGFCPGRGR